MENAEQHVLTCIEHWLSRDLKVWLCTVVKAWGSSPRPPGSIMALNEQGEVAGSVSGGCVEDDLIERLLQTETDLEAPILIDYGVNKSESERLGLPCGGQLKILIEPMQRDSITLIQALLSRLDERQCASRRVDLGNGQMHVQSIQRPPGPPQLSEDEKYFTAFYGPRYHLFLVGAGQIASYMIPIAHSLDFKLTLCDPRPEVMEAFQRQYPELSDLDCVVGMPDDAVKQHANDPLSAIVTLTHDPRIDDMALMEALTGQAFYIGALGSVRTSSKRKERLLELDLSYDQIQKLHAPVGLAISSKTPAEIAVAIMAHIIAMKASSVNDSVH